MSISITLPDDAQPYELAAASVFFRSLCIQRQQAEDDGEPPRADDPFPNYVEPTRVSGPTVAERSFPKFADPQQASHARIGSEESTAVAEAVDAALATDAAAAAAAFSAPMDDVPEFPTSGQPVVPVPPVPPAPPAHITPAAAAVGIPTTAPGGQPLDKTGLPWDKRIHSSTQAVNADGTWRKRKGLNDPGMVQRVEAELRAALGAPAAPPVPVAPPVPQVPFTPPPVPSAAPQVGESPSAPPAGSAPITFAALMVTLGPLLNTKQVTTEHITQAMAEHSLPPGLPVLATRPDLVPSVYEAIKRIAGLQ